MSGRQPIPLRFLYNPVIHRPDAAQVGEVELTLIGAKRRHAAQATKLSRIAQDVRVTGAAFPEVDPLLDQCACYEVGQAAREITFLDGEPQFREVIYLFNLIIALEWNPGPASLQKVRLAAARAAEFLYDVTNGYMSIGQVIIGGPDLMDVADIQIMASNRLHPRAWMAALNEESKFKPIRVGRGLWQKNQQSLLTWESPEGYRALVHEWGHYAFGLRDEYLKVRRVERDATRLRWKEEGGDLDWYEDALGLALPDVALAVESLMANTQISEFSKPDKTFADIGKYYTLLTDGTPLDGPAALSLPLPAILELQTRTRGFAAVGAPYIALDPASPEDTTIPIGPAIAMALETANVSSPELDTHWLYLLKGPFDGGAPRRVVAQGKISPRDREAGAFQLLGAAAGDRLVLVSQVDTHTVVSQAELSASAAPTARPGALQVAAWADATPPGLAPNTSLFVDVIPAPIVLAPGAEPPMHADLLVREEAPQRPAGVHVYPSGAMAGIAAPRPGGARISDPVAVPHLDGHVLLRWEPAGGSPEAFFLCSFSLGGGPRTSSGGILPITAGSADGNAMIFFNENVDAPSETNLATSSSLRMVTTTITAGQQQITGGDARSYIFSVASNEPLGDHKASLVLYYDNAAPSPSGDLLVYRWNGADWQRLTTFLRSDLPYVAVPLGRLDDTVKTQLETAPGLTDPAAQLHVERYRVFFTPR